MGSPDTTPEDRIAYVLARINAGLALQWSQITQLDEQLRHTLKDMYELGEPNIPSARRSEWDEAWNGLRTTIDSIRSLGSEARNRFNADASLDPLEPWTAIFEHHDKFHECIATVREIGTESIPPQWAIHMGHVLRGSRIAA